MMQEKRLLIFIYALKAGFPVELLEIKSWMFFLRGLLDKKLTIESKPVQGYIKR